MPIIDPEPVGSFVARICHNSLGWVRPSGDAEDTEKMSHAATYGYGHEEWLLDFETLIDGWKYGSIEIGRARKGLQGKAVEVFLYTIQRDKLRVPVGRICPCFILSDDECREARARLEKDGAVKRMIDDVKAVEGNPKTLEHSLGPSILTVRFRPEDFRPVARIAAERGSWIDKRSRYQFMAIPDDVRNLWVGTDEGVEHRRTEGTVRGAVPAAPVLYRHNEIQNRLADLLRRPYGRVLMEAGHVDIRLEIDGEDVLIEVKCSTDPRDAIREALGQLLEYAHYDRSLHESPRLVVAAPGRPTAEVQAYLAVLRERYGLRVDYVEANANMLELPTALASARERTETSKETINP